MVLKKFTYEFEKDGTLVPSINGKILKVVAITKEFIPELKLRIRTNENEEVINTQLENNLNVYYPYNILNKTHPENFRHDYFYSLGPLGIQIKGLKESQSVLVKIFYEE